MAGGFAEDGVGALSFALGRSKGLFSPRRREDFFWGEEGALNFQMQRLEVGVGPLDFVQIGDVGIPRKGFDEHTTVAFGDHAIV